MTTVRVNQIVKFAQGALLQRPGSNQTLALQLQQHAARRPNHPFLRYERTAYSYADANRLINQHAHAYAALGIKKGDVVALMLENRPAFLFHLFGLHKLGAIASLINTHATGDVLLHALSVCEPAYIVVGSEVLASFASVRPAAARLAPISLDLDPHGPRGDHHDFALFSEHLRDQPDTNPASASRLRLDDVAAYIYTSGTTGLPKPAVIKHARFYRAGRVWGSAAFQLASRDVVYNCLPLYHSNALLLATGSTVTFGATLALSRRFSASRLWQEAREHGATSMIYIGELCRYLMTAPERSSDTQHQIRVAVGNGLRPDLWEAFQQRFGITRVAEFYGATEGNCLTINTSGVVGSVGKLLPGMKLARWDSFTQQLARDAQHRLIAAKPGEPGLLLGRIRPRAEFDGYRDPKASEQKIIRDAFSRGDAWFNTGDLLRMDKRRNLFFVDRMGDTFRWKGENVSTYEVEQVLSKWPAAQEANVYGVAVHGTEGRAGMAALVLENESNFDPEAFKDLVDTTLPAYARPLFVRLRDALETTGTLKLKKTLLQEQGFDPSVIDDELYFLHSEHGRYVRLTPELYGDVMAGRVRL